MITDYYFLSNRINHLEKQIEILMERLDEVQCKRGKMGGTANLQRAPSL